MLSFVFVVNFVLLFTLIMTARWWASPSADAINSYPLRMRGGPTYFCRPEVGRYILYGISSQFGLIASLAGLMWWYRSQIVPPTKKATDPDA